MSKFEKEQGQLKEKFTQFEGKIGHIEGKVGNIEEMLKSLLAAKDL